MTTFFVAGDPAPQGSKKHVGNGRLVEASKKLKPWRATVARAAATECVPIDGPVVVRLEFVMHRPKATPKTKPTPPAVKRPDVDKLARGVLDGLTGRAYGDDSQVTKLIVSKRIAELDEPTGCMIHVYPEQIREWGTDPVEWTITVGEAA